MKLVAAGERDVTGVDSSITAGSAERGCDEDSGAEAFVSAALLAFPCFWFKDLATLRGIKGSMAGVGEDGGGCE